MSKTNIVIVAGGLGTRFEKLSVFPKILLPTSTHNSILNEIQDSFCDYNRTITLIINEKFYDMVLNYISVNKIQNIKVVKSTKTNGSFNTIMEVYNELPNKDVLFVWSDLIFTKGTSSKILSDCETTDKDYLIFCYEKGEYRYNLSDDLVFTGVDDLSGNIPGIYFVKDLMYIYSQYTIGNGAYKQGIENSNMDLLDFIIDDYNWSAKNPSLEKINIEELTEYRDLKTYINILKNHKRELAQTRFFNKIEIDTKRKVVKKQAIDPDYYDILEKEFKWYRFVEEKIYKNRYDIKRFIPETWGYNYDKHFFSMQYLEGYLPLHEYLKDASKEDTDIVYKNIQNALDTLKSVNISVYQPDAEEDIEKELFTKVIARCEKIKHYLVNYNKSELEEVLNKIIEIFVKLEYAHNRDMAIMSNLNYTLCHGDLNGSNVMVDPKTKDIMFIDPRGYFGLSRNYGLQSYEYAKLLYALSGYDAFNLNPQIYGYDEIKKLPYYDTFVKQLDGRHIILLGIIWVALAGYISQDIVKANMAYEHGLEILKDFLNNYGDKHKSKLHFLKAGNVLEPEYNSYFDKIASHNENYLNANKYIISDVDGILTESSSYYTEDGKVMKKFGAYDTEMIEFMKSQGWKFIFVSKDKNGFNITKKRIEDLKCQIIEANVQRRKQIIETIKQNDNIDFIAYFGDSLSDIAIFRDVDFGATVNNAPHIVKNYAQYVSKLNGGFGGFADICNYIHVKLNLEEKVASIF